MLKLKKIQILGFKSFCDKTEVALPGHGIAVIVGPNGCGKSNILDGVTWVLGEQSAKSLRGGEMKDVIFAGTRDRRALGMAEVTITLVDPEVYAAAPEPEVATNEEPEWDEGLLRAARAQETEGIIAEQQPGQNLEPDGEEVTLKVRRRRFHRSAQKGEVVVTRRLFRTGESEYLLNGKLCRLADIRDIFMGTGLGPESYAIIGQERIGQLLSSKPHDRRAIIEEAAGITRYKTKKRLAELRLEQTRQNLARIEDIFEEVARQMVTLKRQAAKAERYGLLRDERAQKLRVALGSKLAGMDAEAARLEAGIASLSAGIEAQAAEHAELSTELAEGQQRGYALEADAKTQSRAANEAALEGERLGGQERRNRDRLAELDARTAQNRAELGELHGRLATLAGERAEQKAFLDRADAEAAATREEAGRKQAAARDSAAAGGAAAGRREAARREATTLLGRVGEARREQAQAEEALAGVDRDAGRLTGELDAARREGEASAAGRFAAQKRAEAAEAELARLEAELAAMRAGAGASRTAETEARRRADALRAERGEIAGRRNALEGLLREHSYSSETVKKLLRAGTLAGGMRPVGTLADFIEVGDRYETGVDDFLRDELNYIVVKSWDAADEGMRLLKAGPGGVEGRATFLVHPEDAQARFSFTPGERVGDPSCSGVVSLKDCIRVLDGFGKSLEVILPKLRDGFVAPDADIARGLALENPDAFFLTPGGECFHNVTVTGGTPRAQGPLALKRELREAETLLAGVGTRLAAAEEEAASAARSLAELVKATDERTAQRRDAERAHAHATAALRQTEGEQQRLSRRAADLGSQSERAAAQRLAKQELIARKGGEAASLRDAHGAVEARQGELQAVIVEARTARDRAQALAAEAAATLAALEERRRAAQASYARGEQMFAEGERRRVALEGQIAGAAAERETRSAENVSLAARAEECRDAREAAEERAAALGEEVRALRVRLAEAEGAVRQLSAALDAARERKSAYSTAAARLAAEMAHLQALAVEDLGLEAEALREQVRTGAIEVLAGEPLAAEEEACRELKRRMEALGPVNMMALDEFNEAETRHGFLAEQRKDLLDSIENIRASVRELDEISRTRFDEAFARINEHFDTVFVRLFGGGQASMRLTDEENQGDSGVDIVAQPPGKKLQNIFLLSGGEKALTALSLLMGIFMHQPAPFCVLDEVDAPLDETNVGRLAEMLRSMAEDTQFVMVTHSKRMMTAADMIYGVTMQEPGVSKLVSVRLNGKAEQRGRAEQRELALA